MIELERRFTPGTVAFRAVDGGLGHLGGYALKYNRLSQNMGGWVERIAAGAFAKSLGDGGDVLARFQHDDLYLLGRSSAGTLSLDNTDGVGLQYDVPLPDTSYARDLAALAARGDVRHSSFAFRAMTDEWGLTEQGFPLRTLTEAQLVDVAPVVQPAYLDTSSGLRSLAEARGLDLAEVAKAAAANHLTEIVTGESRSKPDETPPGDTHGASRLLIRRRQLELLRLH